MPITKRSSIDNSILQELKEKYPIEEAENGVRYKQKLEYLTFETDFLSDPVLRTLNSQYGFAVIAVIFFLRTEMCKNGWKVRIDENLYYNALVDDCSYFCGINQQTTHDIIQQLIQRRLMYVVQDSSIEEGVWLTCIQQVYNYEMACNNRQGARRRQAKKRKEEQNMKEQLNDIIDNPFGLPVENPFG